MLVVPISRLTSSDKLWFADKGVALRQSIVKLIEHEAEKDCVRIDLSGIKVTDTSFAREAFVKLVSHVAADPSHPQIRFLNVDEYVKQNLHLSFKDHNLFSMILNAGRSWNLIGKFSEPSVETVRAMVKLKTARVRDVSKELGSLELSTVNNRLVGLYQACIVGRLQSSQESGGIEYTYSLAL
jgi:hypothetical protein